MAVRSKKIEIDNDHRIYIFPKKIVYKERIGGRFVTKFVGVSFNALLESPAIDGKIKGRMKEIITKLS